MPKVTKARKCPLCAKENLKHLSEHLKNKHKLLSKQERAPYLSRRLLKMKNEGEEEKQHFRKNGTVKKSDTVIKEADENDEAIAVLQMHERKLGDDFQYIEDAVVQMQMKSAGAVQKNAMLEETMRIGVREKLVPVFQMVMKAFASSLCVDAPITSTRQKQNHTECSTELVHEKKPNDVKFSGGGLEFLENDLVRCSVCQFTWDGNAQHPCPADTPVNM